jgi:hypothetical protein
MGGIGAAPAAGGNTADTIISRLVAADNVPWYKKRNLRYLYLMLIPTAMGVEMTSGFDSSMMNGLQNLDSWDSCKFPFITLNRHSRSMILTNPSTRL